MNKIKSIITIVTFSLVLSAISLTCWLKPHTKYSEAERRPLATLGEINTETILSGEFVESLETYTADQFPMRDGFRTLKAFFTKNVLLKQENNGLYYKDGHLSKLEYPQNEDMLSHAADRFTHIYNSYLKDTDTKIYLSVIPDKNYFLAEKNGLLSLDYDKFISDFAEKVPFMERLDVTPLLAIDDFYRTDSHWKQESITDVAEFLASSMGTNINASYTENILDNPFRGVYLGQSALPVKPDTIKYLTNDVIDSFVVTYYDNGMPVVGSLYNMDKAFGKDPYEMFLSGTSPFITIENPKATAEKELVLFRDSYGSSIAPLLAQGYSKVTVIDIRYMQSDLIGYFMDFSNQDVLFLYSTTLLNNSTAMK